MHWYSVLPPLVAIAVVLWKKEVILALALAVLSAELLILVEGPASALWQSPINSVERVIEVASNPGNMAVLLFSVLVGALLAYIRDSGGVTATVALLINRGVAKSKKQVGMVTMFTGLVVFIESNLSVLTAGILSRGLFDRFKMSRARLAYIIDSTSAPVCILILLNGWGAFVLGLLNGYELEQSSAAILWGTVPFNFYAIITLLIVFYTISFDKVHGPMKQAEFKQSESLPVSEAAPATKARFMLVPMFTMVASMFAFMLWTGDGELAKGSGSRSVLYATILSCVVCYVLFVVEKRYTHNEMVEIGFKGMGELLPLMSIVLLSLTLGASLKELGTGVYVASIVGEHLPLFLIAPFLFLAGALMSFTTGTSWGTFAILIPIGVPLIQTLGLPAELIIAAILGGGIFGDHCSPISDTTCVSAIASGCDLLEHVRTQLPYAMAAGVMAFFSYIAASLFVI